MTAARIVLYDAEEWREELRRLDAEGIRIADENRELRERLERNGLLLQEITDRRKTLADFMLKVPPTVKVI